MTDASPGASGAGVAAALIALAGPIAGEYMAIIVAALLGGFWALSARATVTRVDAALFLLRMVGTAALFSGSAAYLIERQFEVPAQHALTAVAFLIAFYGDRWLALLDRLWARLLSRVFGSEGGAQ